MTDPNTAVHRCQQQVKEAQEKGNKDAELLAWEELGMLQLSLEQFTESIECHQNLIRIAKETNQRLPEGRANYKIAHAYSLLSKYEESIEYYHKSIHALIGKQDYKTERMAYYNIGIQYSMLGNNIKSIEYLETSLNMAVTAADRHVEKGCCFNLANSNLSLGRYEKAIFYFQRTLWLSQQTGDFCKPIEVITCSLGNAYAACGKYGEAIKHHKQSLEYAIQNDNKNTQKDAYLGLGSDSYRLHDYPKAVEYFKKYQNIAELTDDKKGDVDGYTLAGNAFLDMSSYEAALECFQNSLRIAIEIQDKEREEYGYTNIALAYNKLGIYKEAIEHLGKSLVRTIERGDRKKEGQIYMTIGISYINSGSHAKGIEQFKKCLVISRETSDRGQEKIAHSFIGTAHQILGNYKDAIESHERCLSLSKETGDKSCEEKAIYQLGILYGALNDHEKATEYLEKTLRTVVEKGDRLSEANVCLSLGNVYKVIGRYDEAFKILKKSLHIALEIGDFGMQIAVHEIIASVHSELGNIGGKLEHLIKSHECALKSGDKRKEAMAYRMLQTAKQPKDHMTMLQVQNARKQLQAVENNTDKSQQLFAYLDLGKAYYFTGNFKDAETYLKISINIAKEVGDRNVEAISYGYLGDVYKRDNSPDTTEKACQCYDKQLQLCNDIGNKRGVGDAYSNLGDLFLSLYLRKKSKEQKEKAACYLIESLRTYDFFFKDLGDEDERKINVIETFIFTHKLLVELYIETGELEKALLVSEQERGRALEDILRGKYMLDATHKPTYDFLGYADIESKVLSSDTNILFFTDMMKTRRSNFELQVGTWVLDVENHVTFYRNELKQTKALFHLDQDVQRSKDILHVLVDKAYFTMSVQRSVECEDRSFSIRGYNSADSAILDAQDSYKRCVYDEELNENYLEVLYDTLIAPVQDELIHEEIVIVPNGPLFKVPFAALRNPQTGSFLSETKRLRIAPSLTTLKIMKESSAESHSLTGALIVGDPDVDGKRILRGKERRFHSLPNARLEAERIGKVLGVEALTGKQASKQVFIEQLRQGVAVIHLAAHGCAETGEIILSPSADHPTDKIPEEEDYLLTINEVQQIGLRARLVVLSCCHSGRGKIKSEGVIGMSRAFLAAGALAVVASLWAVDDEGTRVFMEQFYTHLKQGKTASTSLQQAMKDMRNMPRFNKPMYWAPFVLIGDDVTINID